MRMNLDLFNDLLVGCWLVLICAVVPTKSDPRKDNQQQGHGH